jgi:4a-hydroxytetrahydrobiopterin dehydratase
MGAHRRQIAGGAILFRSRNPGFVSVARGQPRRRLVERKPDTAEAPAGAALEIEETEVQPRGAADRYGSAESGIVAIDDRSSPRFGYCLALRYMFHIKMIAGNDQFGGNSRMTAEKPERVYNDAEIEAWLAANLPHWTLESGWIRRKYRTSGWKGTLMVVNTIGHLAEAAWHHPDITLSYAWLEVRLSTHSAKGITDKDFALARKIEEVVQWQPGLEGGGLEGTPRDDQRFAYIKYD